MIRLFVNLLDNAIKYSERGMVRISAKHVENKIGIQVMDTGVGITPEHLLHVFDRFYRVDESRTQRGIGLGLAIAREIVSAHKGQIEVGFTYEW